MSQGKRTDDDLSTGIRREGKGYRAWQRVAQGPGGLKSQRFSASATLTEMKQWRESVRVKHREQPQVAPPEPLTGFVADALTYLATVRAMPSLRDRTQHIEEWASLFGDRPRSDIASAEIRAQRDRWLTIGPRRVFRKHEGAWQWVAINKPLSPHSVNLRLRALENLWTILDGPKAPNLVREVPECEEPPAQPRGATFAIVHEILSHMPDRTSPKKGGTWEIGSKSRARIESMLWTGLAHSQLAQLRAHHVDYERRTYMRPARRKGRRGARNRPIAKEERPRPLLPQAIAALKRFFALGCEGKFSRSSLYKSWKKGIDAANVTRAAQRRPLIPTSMRPYDVKHTFGREAYEASKDQRAVQELLGLSSLALTDVYTEAAIAPAAAEAAAKMSARAEHSEASPTTANDLHAAQSRATLAGLARRKAKGLPRRGQREKQPADR